VDFMLHRIVLAAPISWRRVIAIDRKGGYGRRREHQAPCTCSRRSTVTGPDFQVGRTFEVSKRVTHVLNAAVDCYAKTLTLVTSHMCQISMRK
jgi:hypothetical protein